MGEQKIVITGEQATPEFLRSLEDNTELRELTIWSGPVRNEDLEPLRRLTQLTSLCLGEMRVDDGIFEFLKPLRQLDTLILAYTAIRGDFTPLAGIPLRDVRLEGNRFVSDACAVTLATFPTLRNVEMHMTGLTDAGLRWLSELPLEVLWLGPRITDAGLASIAGMISLKHMDLCAHMVTDEGIASLADLKRLEVLWVTRCSVTDASVPVLAGFQALKELNVNDTGITESGMARLRAALPGTRFVEPD
jgi:hypothetical protein